MKTISRDTQYFNSKIYSFTNLKLRKMLKAKAKEKGLPVFYLINDALRNYLEVEESAIPSPKMPQLI